MTFIVVPHGGKADLTTRTYELSYRTLRRLKVAAIVAGVVLLLMVGSWFFLAAQATRVQLLQRDVRRLEGEVAQKEQLQRQLVQMEARLAQINQLLGGVSRRDTARENRVRAAEDTASDSTRNDSSQAFLPRAWPLATRGFVTRGQRGRRSWPPAEGPWRRRGGTACTGSTSASPTATGTSRCTGTRPAYW
jgi:uncharacterized protein YjeT (DUF2065 family)